MDDESIKQLDEAIFEVKRIVVGQDRAIERLFVCLLAGGDCILEGPPGLAKSLTSATLTTVVGEGQVLPGGPAGEIPDLGAKGGSVVLEARPAVDGESAPTLDLAQRDRFLMKVVLGYPSAAEEVEIVHRSTAASPPARQVLGRDDLQRLKSAVEGVYVDRGVVDYAVSVVQATREPATYGMADLGGAIALGASPRASIALVAAGRALATVRNRAYALPQDVFDVAPEVLRHRLVLSPQARAQGLGVEHVLARILSTVAAPRIAPSQHAGAGPGTDGVS